MNELDALGAVLAPPDPSADTVSRGRHDLVRAMEAPGRSTSRRGRTIWLSSGAGVIGAAAATVVAVVLSGSGSPHAQPGAGQGAMSATHSKPAVAHPAPTSAKRYWHVREVTDFHSHGGHGVYETWTTRTGRTYPAFGDGTVRGGFKGPHGFALGLGGQLSYQKILELPTEPKALTASLRKLIKRDQGLSSAQVATEVDVALIALLADVPAPDPVRAAAVRALAASPNATSDRVVHGLRTIVLTGFAPPADKLRGGHEPPNADEMRLSIDPASSLLRVQRSWQGTERVTIAEWTADRPPLHKD